MQTFATKSSVHIIQVSVLLRVQNEVLPDRFIVCGERYKDLREQLAEIVINKDVGALTEKIAVNGCLT